MEKPLKLPAKESSLQRPHKSSYRVEQLFFLKMYLQRPLEIFFASFLFSKERKGKEEEWEKDIMAQNSAHI